MNYGAEASPTTSGGRAVGRHVDLYRIDVEGRRQIHLATIWSDGFGFQFDAHGDVEKHVLTCLDVAPHITELDQLGSIFDSPECIATKPHGEDDCPFCDEDVIPLRSRPSRLKLLGDHSISERARA